MNSVGLAGDKDHSWDAISVSHLAALCFKARQQAIRVRFGLGLSLDFLVLVLVLVLRVKVYNGTGVLGYWGMEVWKYGSTVALVLPNLEP